MINDHSKLSQARQKVKIVKGAEINLQKGDLSSQQQVILLTAPHPPLVLVEMHKPM